MPPVVIRAVSALSHHSIVPPPELTVSDIFSGASFKQPVSLVKSAGAGGIVLTVTVTDFLEVLSHPSFDAPT